MSSALRLSMIMVLLFATGTLGLIAYGMYLPTVQEPPAQVTEKAPPATVDYFVAAHPLPRGTLARDEDFAVRSAPSGTAPTGAILDTPDAKTSLRGSLVRNFLDTGSLVTSEDILRPRERGFLASVLAPDSRAISINVDAASGVSGLIWPGDYVDVVWTQDPPSAGEDKTAQQRGAPSEIVAQNVRVVAIDQEIVQGGAANTAAAGKLAHTVSLQLAPEQVKKVTIAGQRGRLTLAVRSAVDRQDAERTDATVVVHAPSGVTTYLVKKDDSGIARTAHGSDVWPPSAQSTSVASNISSRR